MGGFRLRVQKGDRSPSPSMSFLAVSSSLLYKEEQDYIHQHYLPVQEWSSITDLLVLSPFRSFESESNQIDAMATAQSRLAGWSHSGRNGNGNGRNYKAVTTTIITPPAAATASSSTAASRKWYTRCLPGCVTGNHKSDINTDSDDDDDHHGAWTQQQVPVSVTQIDDFLSAGSSSSSISRQTMVVVGQYQPLSESSSNSKFQQPKASSTITGPIPECLEELPFEARPSTSLSKWFGEGEKENAQMETKKKNSGVAVSAATPSEISLCSTLSGSVVVNEWEKPFVVQQQQHQQSSHIETPDDFDRFRVTELDSRPVEFSAAAAAAAANAPELEAVVVDSTPIPVENHRFVAYPGRETKVSLDNYIPPMLQAGWAGGVPRMLIAGRPTVVEEVNRSTPNFCVYQGQYQQQQQQQQQAQPQSAQIIGAGSKSQEVEVPPRYSWPLVDFDQELFLDSNPAQGRRRHQEPRIPSLEFEEDEGHRGLGLGLGLEGQVAAAMMEKTQTRPRGRAVVVPGAFPNGSPISPLNEDDAAGIKGQGVYEMEASATSERKGPSPSQAPVQNAASQSMSPVSPMDDDNAVAVTGGSAVRVPVVKYHEYNWPRFSDVHEYQDPADEYSRRYRDRRRELRKRENGRENGKERVPVPKHSRIPRLQVGVHR
ncbi:hypothetical protein HRR83_005174 [Exophiala dermatitidis]|nr:hypothetical protein HRR75_004604 [Exophiala dermatitidis]KAJ4515869.1 hypothetical protein HRR74_005026 [Exophiala dermatitidis]KAJ4518724.1 hypothetical protein HRR73_004305 [Exophiala dermatitidis]KAJ4545868.1 hypothetical protein HRR78_005707 [Exophiala dermatitidis]KAJ4550393.1 hypothetical protein HRR77_003858 [Exophiala dermatitidis]